MRCDFAPIEQTSWSYSINAGTDSSNSSRIVYAFQDPGSYLITNLRTSNPASSGHNNRIKNRRCTKSFSCFEHEAVFSAEPIGENTDSTDLITWNAIAIAVVQGGRYKSVSGADEMQRGNFVESNKTNAY